MKLLKLPFTKRRLLAMMVGLVACGGVAQAQFTGIGHTNPQATLHIIPVTVGQEPLRVESMIDLTIETTYTDVLLYDPASGLMRRESVADLLDDNGEWIENGAGDAIIPRRYQTAMSVNNSLVSIGATATTVGGTFTVTGTSTLNGATTVNNSFAVSGTNTTSLGGVVTLGTVNDLTTPVNSTDQILFHGPSGVVEKADVADVLASNGQWIVDGSGNLVPRVAAYNGDIAFTGTIMDVNVPTEITGTLDVTGNSTIAGTFTVTGAGNPSSVAGTMSIGTVAQVTAADLIGTDEILLQQAGTNLVEYVTVADLMSANSYWDEDANVLTPSNSAIEDEISIADENVDITANDIDFAGTNVDVTGAFGVAGTFTVTGAGNPSSLDGTLSIGTVAEISGGPLTGLDEILLQRAGTNLVEYVTVQDLLSSNGEWVFADGDSDGVFDDTERVYLRRNGNGDGNDDDVYVTGVGDVVVDGSKAYQFGAATSQINAIGITAADDYTVDVNGGSLTFATDANEDVSFTENNEPWLYYQASDDYSPTNAFGNSGNERGRVGINTNAPEATLHVAGNIVASNVTVTSDRRFKKDIKDISGALDLVKALRGVSYDFRADEFPKENFDKQNHIGFIAQEIKEVLPQTVMERGDGYLTVDYAAVTPVLVEAVQELSKQVEALQAENATLRSTSTKSVGAVSTKQLRELEARLADMDARLQEVAGRK